jgi:hypothetical protein
VSGVVKPKLADPAARDFALQILDRLRALLLLKFARR